MAGEGDAISNGASGAFNWVKTQLTTKLARNIVLGLAIGFGGHALLSFMAGQPATAALWEPVKTGLGYAWDGAVGVKDFAMSTYNDVDWGLVQDGFEPVFG